MMETAVGKHLPEAAARTSKFIALSVLFQSLVLALLIFGAALLRGWAIGRLFMGSIPSLAICVILLSVLIWLMLWSYRRYKRMWSKTICMSFVAWVELEERRK